MFSVCKLRGKKKNSFFQIISEFGEIYINSNCEAKNIQSENYIKIVKKITVNLCSQKSSHEISDDIFWQPTPAKRIQYFLIDYPPVLAQTNFPNS